MQSGSVDASFRCCAQSLVDLLLQSPGESSLGADTWRQLSSTQARLPHKLGQVLGIACSLLQRKVVETADTRAKRKRRRYLSSSLAALKVPTPQLPPPCTTGLVAMVRDMAREEEEQEVEKMRRRQEEGAELSVNPPLLPPSQVLPLLLQQPLQPVPLPAQLQLSAAAAAPHRERTPPPPHAVYACIPAAGGTEADFPVLLPHRASAVVPSPPRPASLASNGNHHGPPSHPLQETSRPLEPEGSLAEQSVGAASLGSNGNHHGCPSHLLQEASRPLEPEGSLAEQSVRLAASEPCPSVP
ncbi:unnamed protein product [Ectocarpus fasciculatus]